MFCWPVMRRDLTSRYGPRTLLDRYGRPYANFHNGLDFGWLNADITGSRRVYSVHPGTVTDVAYSSEPGNYIMVDIGNGLKVRYIHLSSVAVRPGQRVGYSTFLGVMGDTGTSTSQIHLHLDLYRNGVRVNPEPYFSLPFGYTGPALSSGSAPTPTTPEAPRKAAKMYILKTTDNTLSLVTDNGIAHFTDMAHVDLFVRLVETEPGKWDTFNSAEREIIRSYLHAASTNDDADQRALLAAISKINATGGATDLTPVLAAVKSLPAQFIADLKAAL